MTGEVGPKRAKIVVHDGGEGSILGDGSFSGANPRKLATEVGLTFWKKLGPDVGRGHVPSGAKKPSGGRGGRGRDTGAARRAKAKPRRPSPRTIRRPPRRPRLRRGGAATKKKKSKVKMEETPPEEASAPAVPSGRAWLDFELGMGGYNRSLTFNQNLTPSLLSYTLGVGPIAVANVVMYPLDPLFGRPARQHRPRGGDPAGFAISSTLSQRRPPPTSDVVHDYAGGGRYRFTFGAANDVYVSVTGGEDAFTFTGRSRRHAARHPRHHLPLRSPRRWASTWRLAAGSRVRVERRIPRRPQPRRPAVPADFFPHSTVAGADAELEARYALSDMFQVRAGLEWRRYWFAMHSRAQRRQHQRRRHRGRRRRPVVRLHGAHRDPDRQQQRPQGGGGRRGGAAAAARPTPRAAGARPTTSRPATATRVRPSRPTAATRAATTPTSSDGAAGGPGAGRAARPDSPRHGRVLRVRRAARRPRPARAARSSSAVTPIAASCWRPPTRSARSACGARCRWPARCAWRPTRSSCGPASTSTPTSAAACSTSCRR